MISYSLEESLLNLSKLTTSTKKIYPFEICLINSNTTSLYQSSILSVPLKMEEENSMLALPEQPSTQMLSSLIMD